MDKQGHDSKTDGGDEGVETSQIWQGLGSGDKISVWKCSWFSAAGGGEAFVSHLSHRHSHLAVGLHWALGTPGGGSLGFGKY